LKTSQNPRFTQYLILFFGVMSISTAAIIIRYAQAEANSLVIAAARMIISTLPLIPIVLIRHTGELRKLTRRSIFLSLLSGLFLAIHFATWITSLEYTSIASSVVLVCTTPIWVTLFGVIVYHEKVSRAVLLGIGLALVGGIFVALNEACSLSFISISCNFESAAMSGRSIFGNILAFIGALMAAGYLLIGRAVRKKVSLVPYAFIVYGTSAIVLSGWIFASHTPVGSYSPMTYLYFVLLAVFPQLIGHSSLNWALKYLPTTYVAIAQMGEPVGSTILAIVLFNEVPSPLKIIGALFILAGIYTVSRKALSG
jgi:drug/metabolite transporter (DMT)-like permease